MQIYLVTCIFLFEVISKSAAIECFACSHVKTVEECKNTQSCNAGEICYTDVLMQGNGTLYSFGCRSEKNCTTIVSNQRNATNGGGGLLVGRSLSSTSCYQCCKEHHCNRQLCQQTYSLKECSDKENVGCVTLEQYANICADTQRALSVCRRTCGLCSYVDGRWASWLAWSTCDVTCGDGHQARIRTCTEPPPAGGGQKCQGNSDESQHCTLQPCPVRGHWSAWSSWGSCSTTCGIGMQRRDRTCSNPYPARFGDHCFGDSRDDRLCVDSVCPVTDGAWSSWTSWTACTASCGGGVKSHYRDCNNPMPSAGGKLSSFLYSQPINAGPGYAFARMKGSMVCSHFPFNLNVKTCSSIAFKNQMFEEGSYYSSTTGDFTCFYSGVYVFTASLLGSFTFSCDISKNDVSMTKIMKTQSDAQESRTGTVTVHLLRGDKISLFCQHFADNLDSHSTFGGFLLHSDN